MVLTTEVTEDTENSKNSMNLLLRDLCDLGG